MLFDRRINYSLSVPVKNEVVAGGLDVLMLITLQGNRSFPICWHLLENTAAAKRKKTNLPEILFRPLPVPPNLLNGFFFSWSIRYHKYIWNFCSVDIYLKPLLPTRTKFLIYLLGDDDDANTLHSFRSERTKKEKTQSVITPLKKYDNHLNRNNLNNCHIN